MSQYKTGTVSVTTGDQTVTGTNTLWVANVNPGDGFTVAGTGVPYTVASVTNDTSLELSAPYTGATASGQSYAIYRDFTTNNNYPELSQGDIETATIWTRALRLIDGDVGAIEADYYNTANILGTVSQSAGVPTGAIIEAGSNANGEYTKYADGTIDVTRVCYVDLSLSSTQIFNLSASVIDMRMGFSGTGSANASGTIEYANKVLGSVEAETGQHSRCFFRIPSTEVAPSTAIVPMTAFITGRWF